MDRGAPEAAGLPEAPEAAGAGADEDEQALRPRAMDAPAPIPRACRRVIFFMA
ncbi:hypothetical protein Slala02_59760 [Streptomyces lavendulae subsp. lavendulae]|nr:hypothetical protein Slala01_77810 [Streptomyces lavendulae subsp. lavendulae]GLX30156.1 hypothetical protein Slala02_59760 [Streptomyces lavendulae subsp. lavendulae]